MAPPLKGFLAYKTRGKIKFTLKAFLSISSIVMPTVCATPAIALDGKRLYGPDLLHVLPLKQEFSSSTRRGGRTSLYSRLKDNGFRVEMNYRGEAFYSGRIEPTGDTLYRGLLDIYLGLDTGKGGLWMNGEIFVKLQQGHGNGYSIMPGGVAFPTSNIDAQDFTQISEFGLSQRFLGRKLDLRVTKQDVNSLFCVNDSGGDFIFPSFTLIPTIPMPTFPAPALGLALFADFTKSLTIGAGFYDGGSKVEKIGFDTFFESEEGYFSVIEPALKTAFGPQGALSGNYRIGLWYHSGDFPEKGIQSNPKYFDHNCGFYVMINQTVYRPRGESAEGRGLEIFFQYGWAPDDRNHTFRYWGGGWTFKGLLEDRNEDVLALGVGYTQLNRLATEKMHIGLTNLELFYILRITSWLALQADIQYFSDIDIYHNSGFTVGVRSLLRF